MSTKTLNVLNGLSHVLGALKYDGALDSDGEPVKIGLAREEGHPINDSRVIDGFSVKTSGDRLWICYHLESSMTEIHNKKDFESDIKSAINDVKNFLQKEYKKVTGRALSLKNPTEVECKIENLSRVRASVYASQCFDLGGTDVECVETAVEKDRLENNFKKFLDQGGWDSGKKPENDSRKKEKSTPFDSTRMDSVSK